MPPLDTLIRQEAGPEPLFDPVMTAFLHNVADELRGRQRPGSLLEAVNLGSEVPWLWRLTFATRGLAFDYVLFTNYERQVEAHLRGDIDVAWSSPLAWLETRDPATV